MKYLLDTHVLIWSILENNKISSKGLEALKNFNNKIFVSTITLWEISLKYSIGKLELNGLKPEMLPNLLKEMGYEILDLNATDASYSYKLLGNWHKDPFDRMLITQCIKNNLVLITKDDNIKKYKEEGLITLW